MPDTYLLKRKDQEESLEEVSEKKESATNDSSKLETKELADQTKEAPAQPNEVVAKKSKDQAKEDLEAAKKEAKDALQPAKAKKFSIKDYLAAKSADYRQAWRVCARLVDNFWQKADTLWPNRKRPTASQLKEWVILASIVEKETAVGSERARVAGVYKNRLERKMLLQADPTIIYGLGPNFQGKLLYRHLDDVKNIYNTYQHPGLPPTPICSFGIGALKAAIYPETHNFLYFVAKGGNGEHTFSKNLTDHNLAVEQYRKWTRTHKQ
ncbi:MAG: endolytic transglycosylase MltG [Desulfovibrionaceae bacterium]|nr:endolytic transglycosylase MltG [Desulfovibrionaceae bacterium]